MKVDLFIPCILDQFYPETAFNTVRLLERAGCEVHYNPAQTCCGQLPYLQGFWDDARSVGSKFLDDFSENRYIVTPSASCKGMVKTGYKTLFQHSSNHLHEQTVQSNIVEISDFMVNILNKDYFGAELEGIAVFHDGCTVLGSSTRNQAPLQLLRKVLGLELVDVHDHALPCGFEGNLAFNFEDIAVAMAEEVVQNALDEQANFIISTDPGCLLHLQSYINKHHLPIQTKHIVDVLTTGWGNI